MSWWEKCEYYIINSIISSDSFERDENILSIISRLNLGTSIFLCWWVEIIDYILFHFICIIMSSGLFSFVEIWNSLNKKTAANNAQVERYNLEKTKKFFFPH